MRHSDTKDIVVSNPSDLIFRHKKPLPSSMTIDTSSTSLSSSLHPKRWKMPPPTSIYQTHATPKKFTRKKNSVAWQLPTKKQLHGKQKDEERYKKKIEDLCYDELRNLLIQFRLIKSSSRAPFDILKIIAQGIIM